MIESAVLPLAGGLMIGISAILLLAWYGRIFGVSGILGGLLNREPGDQAWRYAIVAGFLAGGAVLYMVDPGTMISTVQRSPIANIVAGLLVGYGARLGGGCTSGHGVCGIGRFSPRSITGVLTFMTAGVLIVAAVRFLAGGAI